MAGEKTEKATPKRKQDERKKGNVFLSQEVVTVASLLITFYAIQALGPAALSSLEDMLIHYLTMGAEWTSVQPAHIRQLFLDCGLIFLKTAMPLLLICALSAILFTMAQTRGLFSGKSFAFKGERINPLAGFKKMFSMRGLVELFKSLLKVTVLAYVIYSILKDELLTLPRLMDMDPAQAVVRSASLTMSIAVRAGILFVFLAAADYLYQWWQYEKNLRMSKQEIKDEYKQTEGDPQIKGRQRNIQQQRARRRMMQAVPTADVVIRNPTHFAVAIKYDPAKSSAPTVVAKGADSLALRIVAVAEQNGVYVTEDKPLARALYEAVELDQELPERFYQAVAQLLAFVYHLKGDKKP